MDDELGKQLLERLTAIEQRLDTLEADQSQLREAYARSRAHLRRLWLRPPMWTFEQHPPRPLDLSKLPAAPALPKQPPRIAIVTPSLNHGRFVRATIDSVLGQDYPRLFYHVQDGASADETVEILKSYGERISWRSAADGGQSDAINKGFQDVDCDIMAYLNSDDVLLPGTLACVADFFEQRPEVDFVYGHRIFIDYAGMEIGRAVFPAHHSEALKYAGYVPQETMFWRRSLWEKTGGGLDEKFTYALDWELLLRFMKHGARIRRVPRFLGGFRVHALQKTQANASTSGTAEVALLLESLHGRKVSREEVCSRTKLYFARSTIYDALYRLGVLRA